MNPVQPLVAALALAFAAPHAAAIDYDVHAVASQNLVGSFHDSQPGVQASAHFGGGAVITTRTSVDIAVTTSPDQQHHNDANGYHYTTFTLWDLGSNSALSTAAAKALDLRFNFSVTGGTWLDETFQDGSYGPGHGYTIAYSAKAFAGASYAEADATSSRSCGGTSCASGPDQSMAGSFDLDFALDWDGSTLFSNSGILFMQFQASAGGDATAGGLLKLDSVWLTAGDAPAGGLVLRLDQTGGFLGVTPVAAVPEPESYALLLAGLGVVGLLARRRRAGV